MVESLDVVMFHQNTVTQFLGSVTKSLSSVTPAKAGAQLNSQVPSQAGSRIPAYAGMTATKILNVKSR